MEITEEMLDVIEAVKGRREPQYWDNQCRRYMEKQQANKKAVKNLNISSLQNRLRNSGLIMSEEQISNVKEELIDLIYYCRVAFFILLTTGCFWKLLTKFSGFPL